MTLQFPNLGYAGDQSTTESPPYVEKLDLATLPVRIEDKEFHTVGFIKYLYIWKVEL